MLFGPPVALILSITGLFKDSPKVYAILGTLVSAGTAIAMFVPFIFM